MRSAVLAIAANAGLCAQWATCAGRPEVLAFVVGIGQYDNPGLNKLLYAASDAKEVYKQLGVVANLDSRSQLVFAEHGTKEAVTAEKLRSDAQLFARKIRNNTNVVIYLGGHGTLGPDGRLWLVPSDYDPDQQIHQVPMADIFVYIENQITRGRLTGVSVTYLLNVCGAGNAGLPKDGDRAMGDNDDPAIIENVQKFAQEHNFGKAKVAIIPATPVNRNAFESDSLHRSYFANYLLDALEGRGADAKGLLTTGGLFDYIKDHLKQDIRKGTEFENGIVIGQTNTMEGETDLTVGTALIGAALASQTAKPSADGAQTSDLFLDLARRELERVRSRNPDLDARAQLRSATIDKLESIVSPPDGLKALAAQPKLSERERKLAKSLADSRGFFPTLDSLIQYLKAGHPARAAIVTIGDDGQPDGTNRQDVWMQALHDLGVKDIDRFGIGSLDTLISQLETKGEPDSTLILTYLGPARLSDDCRQTPDGRCDLNPFGKDALLKARRAWKGPMVVVFDAPFGGILKRLAPPDVSLLLAAHEPNGMTFALAKDSTETRVLLLDPQSWDRLIQTMQLAAKELTWPNNWVLGTPEWVSATQATDPTLAKLYRNTGLQLIAGCIDQAAEACNAKISEGALMDRIEDAARLDMESSTGAAAAYAKALGSFPTAPDAAGNPKMMTQ